MVSYHNKEECQRGLREVVDHQPSKKQLKELLKLLKTIFYSCFCPKVKQTIILLYCLLSHKIFNLANEVGVKYRFLKGFLLFLAPVRTNEGGLLKNMAMHGL